MENPILKFVYVFRKIENQFYCATSVDVTYPALVFRCLQLLWFSTACLQQLTFQSFCREVVRLYHIQATANMEWDRFFPYWLLLVYGIYLLQCSITISHVFSAVCLWFHIKIANCEKQIRADDVAQKLLGKTDFQVSWKQKRVLKWVFDIVFNRFLTFLNQVFCLGQRERVWTKVVLYQSCKSFSKAKNVRLRPWCKVLLLNVYWCIENF